MLNYLYKNDKTRFHHLNKENTMKFTKMSLVAALLIGSSAFAIENTTVSGNTQLFYQTADKDTTDFLEAQGASADIGLHLNATTDLTKTDYVSVSAGAGLTVLTTLGLENSLVNAPWGGAHMATTPTGASFDPLDTGGAKVDNAWWMNEAWLAATAGKTTVKAGRMALDTPLAFTETWTIEQNTFEAAVVLNTDIPDTTLVGAYIGNGNGTETFGQNLQNNHGLSTGGIVNGNGEFGTFGTDGAYAAGLINNSFEPLTVQAWYYDLTRVTEAYWLQADLSMAGVIAGAQYSAHQLVGTNTKEDNVYAFMLGYEMPDMFTAKVAYSAVNEDGSLGRAGFNVATDAAFAQSKLYTEAWWNYGQVTYEGAKSVNVTVETPAAGYADLGLYVTSIDHSDSIPLADQQGDLLEVTASVSKSFGPLDASLVYINTDVDSDSEDADSQLLQVYLTLNF